MAQLKPISELTLMYAVSTIWTSVVILQMIWRIIVYGPWKFFFVKNREIRPDILDDPALGTHQFARLKSVKLHYVISGPEDRPLMLFLHGFPEFWYSWRHQIKEFSKDYRTVAVDMRGYGESDKPYDVHNYDMESLVADVVELVEFLGYKKCVLAGHDWGGTVAWDVAQCHPNLLEKLIICNSPHATAMLKFFESSIKQLHRSWYIFFFQMPWLPEIWARSNDLNFINDAFYGGKWGVKNKENFSLGDVELFKQNMYNKEAFSGPINYYRARMRYMGDKPPYDTVKVPTLIVWGTCDGFLDAKLAKLSSKYADDCRIHYVDGASHWVQQEEPAQVNQAIRTFLSDEMND